MRYFRPAKYRRGLLDVVIADIKRRGWAVASGGSGQY